MKGQDSVDVYLKLSRIQWTNKMDAKLELIDSEMEIGTK